MESSKKEQEPTTDEDTSKRENKIEIDASEIKDVTKTKKEELIEDLLAELKNKDSLKSEILKELQLPKEKGWFHRFVEHPISLLILGFILTGIIGTLLTSYYQTRDWQRQQKRVLQTNKADIKLAILNDLTKAVSETDAANKAVSLELISQSEINFPKKLKDEKVTENQMNEVIKAANESNRKWFTESTLLQQKLRLYFRNPEIIKTFDEIAKARTSDWVNLVIFTANYNQDKNYILSDNESAQKLRAVSGKYSEETLSLLKNLVQLMYEEIEQDLAI